MSRPAAKKRFYRLRDLTTTFGWSRAWIYLRIGEGKFATIKTDGVVLVDAQSVEDYLAACQK